MKRNIKKTDSLRNAEIVKEAPAKYEAKPAAPKPAPAVPQKPAAVQKPAPAQKAVPSPAPAAKAPVLPGRTPEGKAAAVKSATELAKKVVPESKAAEKPAKKPAEAKAAKEPKEKPFAKSRVEVDASAYVKAHDKLPGTGKREPKTLWKFLIGTTPFQMETEFFRTARLAAVEKAVSLKCEKVAVLA